MHDPEKFAKKLLGESDIEAVLQRLDRLTVEESRMTATQTMEVVYGLFNNMKVVMDGMGAFDSQFLQCAECLSF
jgi:signal recognition particle GTPase